MTNTSPSSADCAHEFLPHADIESTSPCSLGKCRCDYCEKCGQHKSSTATRTAAQRNEAVKAKIVECVPRDFSHAESESEKVWNDACRKITLEDVLQTIPPRYCVDTYGWFHNMDELLDEHEHPLAKWTIGLPFDSQPQETKDFLYSILYS